MFEETKNDESIAGVQGRLLFMYRWSSPAYTSAAVPIIDFNVVKFRKWSDENKYINNPSLIPLINFLVR